jgi:hypothetical protein
MNFIMHNRRSRICFRVDEEGTYCPAHSAGVPPSTSQPDGRVRHSLEAFRSHADAATVNKAKTAKILNCIVTILVVVILLQICSFLFGEL